MTGVSPGREAWLRFRKNRFGMAALIVLLGLSALAVFADFLASDRPVVMRFQGRLWVFPNLTEPRALRAIDNATLRRDMTEDEWAIFPPLEVGPSSVPPLSELADDPPPQAPSKRHPLGTDNTGRDTLARLIHGTRISLSVGFVAVGLALLLGLFLGVIAGWFGGLVDAAVSRVNETLMNFPLLFLLLAMQGMLEKTSIFSTMVVIGLTRWTEPCRLVRAEVLRVRELEYVHAARALGASTKRILVKHVVPNSIAPIYVYATFGVASAILVEAALSFLGFGAPEPVASWGLLLTDGFQSIGLSAAWPLVVMPGLAIFVTVTALNLVGEALRDALDPRLRE